MRHFLVVVGVLVAAAAARGDDEELARIPVGDLLAPPTGQVRPVEMVASQPRGERTRAIAGENALLLFSRGSEAASEMALDGERICAALTALLPEAARRVEFDESAAAIVFPARCRPEVVKALAELRAASPERVAVRISLDRVKGRAEVHGVLTAEAHVRPGETFVVADAVEAPVVTDYSVEIAQAASISDPIVRGLRTGTSAALRIRPLPCGGAAIAELIVRSSRLLDEAPIDLGNPSFGKLDRCAVALDEAASSFRVENGRTAEIEWAGRDGERLRLTIDASWTDAPPPGECAILASATLGSSVLGFRTVPQLLVDDESGTAEAGPEVAIATDSLVAGVLRDPLDAALVTTRRSLVVIPRTETGSAAANTRAFCDALDATLRTRRLEFLAVNVPVGAKVAFDAPLPAESRVVAQADALVLVGLPACFTGGTERRYLADWEVEVAQSARIPDPTPGSFATGHYLTVTARDDAIDVDLDLLRLDAIDRQVMRIAVGRRSQGSPADSSGPVADPSLPEETVAVERPRLAELRISETLPLEKEGVAALRRRSEAFLGAERELVVLARLR